jgi:hypothetical protein
MILTLNSDRKDVHLEEIDSTSWMGFYRPEDAYGWIVKGGEITDAVGVAMSSMVPGNLNWSRLI